jgi:Putative prokaryotic signal transducing protein
LNPNLVTIARFRDLIEAQLAKGKLEAAGIDAFLGNENIVSLDWFYSNAVGGLRLQVLEEDVTDAQASLDEPIPDEIVEEQSGIVYEQPHCPRCDSLDIGYETIDCLWSYGLMFVIAPIPVKKINWKCQSCGAEWVEQ